MDWIQFAVFSISVFGLFLWDRSESRSDIRNIQQEIAADRRDILGLIRSIQDEIRDFHGRLCAIEERKK